MVEFDILVQRAQQRVGTSLRGKLILERLLGVGAMAAVYEAPRRNGSRITVKVLHPEVAGARRSPSPPGCGSRLAMPSPEAVVRVLDDDTAFTTVILLVKKGLGR